MERKGDPKISLEERDGAYVLTIQKVDEKWERFDLERLAMSLREALVERMAPEIERKIFNEVMGEIDVQAIAHGASIRIIQNLGKNPDQNNYR